MGEEEGASRRRVEGRMRGRFKVGACAAAQSACWLQEGHTGNGSRRWSSAFLVKDTMQLRAVRHAIARSAPRDCTQCAAQGLLLSEALLGERFTCGCGATLCCCAGSTAESAAGGAASARSGPRVLMSTGRAAHEARRCDRVPATAALLLLLFAATALGNSVEIAQRRERTAGDSGE